ncbi:hypothetical protein DPMN_001196 [Dreissena polymorpha]|uniref:Uncharacterized protein n=1 Tax=Dreissena polymorpha TaxID=45954 RepID=A0A9D4RSL5_DREPO|nr:hypothetical protein DPMN_001196 [Dreissena polymorpha]
MAGDEQLPMPRLLRERIVFENQRYENIASIYRLSKAKGGNRAIVGFDRGRHSTNLPASSSLSFRRLGM